jgi:hypothetical protein
MTTCLLARARNSRPGLGRVVSAFAAITALALAGCGPTRLTVHTDVPPLLVVPLPKTIGLRLPKSFSSYVQKERVLEQPWEIELGTAQAEAMRRVMNALFEHVVVLEGDARSAPGGQRLDGIIETTLDSYVYLLPTAGSSEFYSATIGFKVNLESPDGTLLGSWIYEGYGSAPDHGLSNDEGVALVSALAIRDACANLAVHLPEQELLRNLLAPAAPAPAPAPPPVPIQAQPEDLAPLPSPPASPQTGA